MFLFIWIIELADSLFVNERKKVISAAIKPVYPNPISDEEVYKVRETLWKNPGLIDEYINTVTLSKEKRGQTL